MSNSRPDSASVVAFPIATGAEAFENQEPAAWADAFTEACARIDREVPPYEAAAEALGLLVLRSQEFAIPHEQAREEAGRFLDSRYPGRRRQERIAQDRAILGDEAVPAGWFTAAETLRHSPLPKARFTSTFPTLNKATKDRGLPTGALIVFQGPPDSGKTGMVIQEALRIGMNCEAVVTIYTPDQGRDATVVRIGGLLGLDMQKLEDRDEEEVAKLDQMLAGRRIFFPDDSTEDGYVRKIIADGEAYCPDLPHVLCLDSLQEARADEKSADASEKERTIANVRACQAAAQSRVQWLILATSQVTKASGSRDPKNRPLDVFAGSDTGKIGFATQMIVSLSGDPAKAPDYGLVQIPKNKLGPKPAFGLRLDAETTRLSEIDAETVHAAKAEREEKAREAASVKMQEKILTAIDQTGVSAGCPGLSTVKLARACGVNKENPVFRDALYAVETSQKVIEGVDGPHGGTYWRRRKP